MPNVADSPLNRIKKFADQRIEFLRNAIENIPEAVGAGTTHVKNVALTVALVAMIPAFYLLGTVEGRSDKPTILREAKDGDRLTESVRNAATVLYALRKESDKDQDLSERLVRQQKTLEKMIDSLKNHDQAK